jgi:FG-GAP repeat protein
VRRILVGSVIGFILASGPSGALAATGPLGQGRSGPQRPDGARSCDFNGDGFRDFAAGAAWETVNGQYAAGGVNVLYGSSAGLGVSGNQFFTQDSPGIPDKAEKGDNFGSALAHADYNGDGFGDLAVGAPSETIGGRLLSGTITIIFGSPSGLSSTGSELLTGSVSDDQLGYSLISRVFDEDGFGDLSAGLPNRRVNGLSYAGGSRSSTARPAA